MSQWDPSPGANPYGSPGSFSEHNQHAEITPQSVEFIRQSRPWAILVGVVAILMSLLMALGAVGAGVTEPVGPLENKQLRMMLIVIYGAMSVAGMVGGIVALRYGSRAARLSRDATTANMEQVLRSMRNIWRVVGVAAAILIILFIFQIVNGLMAAMKLQEIEV